MAHNAQAVVDADGTQLVAGRSANNKGSGVRTCRERAGVRDRESGDAVPALLATRPNQVSVERNPVALAPNCTRLHMLQLQSAA